MLVFKNSAIFLFCMALSQILTSCSYESTDVDLGSSFGRLDTWSFDKSSDYQFDENLVEVVSGEARLKVLDLEQSGVSLNSGTHMGSQLHGTSLQIKSYNSGFGFTDIFPDKINKLSAYWRFENNLASTSSPINHTLTSATSTFGDSIFGDYSGQSTEGISTFSIPDHPDFDTELSTQFTISFWVKFESSGSSHRLLSKACYDGSNWVNSSYMFSRHSGKNLEFSIFDNGSTKNNILGIIQEDQSWVNLVATFNGTIAEFYINGVSQGQTSILNFHDSSFDLILSGRFSGLGCTSVVQNRDSKIDEVIILQEALSHQEVEKLYRNQSQNYIELSSDWTPKYQNVVGHWKMDGNWQDSSGNGYHGTAGFDVGFDSADKKVGSSSATFDGSGDRVDLGDVLNLVGDPISISMWVKPRSYAADVGLVSKFFSGGYRLQLENDGTLFFQIRSGGGFQSQVTTEVVPLNEWTHVLVTHDNATTGKIYINGELSSIKTNYTVIRAGTTAALTIGYDNFGGTSINGNIDEVAFWDKELSNADASFIYNRQKQKYSGSYDSEVIDLGGETSNWPDLSWSTSLPFGKELVGDFDNSGSPDSEVAADYSGVIGNLSNSLVGLWRFNEPTSDSVVGGFDFADSSGFGNHVSENGGVSFKASGQFNYAASFDGVDDQIHLPVSYNNHETFTVSLWAKPSDYSNNETMYCAYRNNGYGVKYCIYIDEGPDTWSYIYHTGGTGPHKSGSIPAERGKWAHVVYTYDGTTYKLYVNGVLDPTIVTTDTLVTTEATTAFPHIGGNNAITPYVGLIDEFAIWSRAISEAEVKEVYRRGANRVKLQVKSCIDSACKCKSYGVSGSTTDCDGDGTLNDLDYDDSHKSEFIGPGGDGATYYSDLYNRSNADLNFQCALNTTDDNPGICVPDEISFSGNSKPTAPEFLNLDYTQFVKPSANRYIQYRVHLEADENTACGGDACLPEFSSVNFNPGGITKYFGGEQVIKPLTPIEYTNISSVLIDADACVKFQLSPDDSDYYWWDGAAWVVATDDSLHLTTKADVEAHISTYALDRGPGVLYIKAYLSTNAGQTSACEIRKFKVF